MTEFLAMGGYGFYVWGSYLVTFALIVIEVVLVRRRQSGMLRRLGRLRRLNAEVSNEA